MDSRRDIDKGIKCEKKGVEIMAEAKNKESHDPDLSKNALKHFRREILKIFEVPMEDPRNDNVMTSLRQLNYAYFGNEDELNTKSIKALNAYKLAYEKITLEQRLYLFFEAISEASFAKQKNKEIQEEYRWIQALFGEIKSGYDILKTLFETFGIPFELESVKLRGFTGNRSSLLLKFKGESIKYEGVAKRANETLQPQRKAEPSIEKFLESEPTVFEAGVGNGPNCPTDPKEFENFASKSTLEEASDFSRQGTSQMFGTTIEFGSNAFVDMAFGKSIVSKQPESKPVLTTSTGENQSLFKSEGKTRTPDVLNNFVPNSTANQQSHQIANGIDPKNSQKESNIAISHFGLENSLKYSGKQPPFQIIRKNKKFEPPKVSGRKDSPWNLEQKRNLPQRREDVNNSIDIIKQNTQERRYRNFNNSTNDCFLESVGTIDSTNQDRMDIEKNGPDDSGENQLENPKTSQQNVSDFFEREMMEDELFPPHYRVDPPPRTGYFDYFSITRRFNPAYLKKIFSPGGPVLRLEDI